MKVEKWIFISLGVFFLIVAAAYWFMTYEVIGSVALTLIVAFCGMLVAYLHIQGRKIDPRPEDRRDAEIIEGAGEVGFFPSSSMWPFWAGLTVAVMSLGPALGWWLTLVGIGMGIWSVSGWAYQYYRDDYQH